MTYTRRVIAIRSCIAAAALSCVVTVAAKAQAPPAWPDTFVGRLEAFAVIQTLNAQLLASRSATQTLETWCGDHQLAAEPKIVARLVTGVEQAAVRRAAARLRVAPTDVVKYRHVQLVCGSRVLSEADNWYVPGRLTAEMNRLLETTETPFGTAVRPLEPFARRSMRRCCGRRCRSDGRARWPRRFRARRTRRSRSPDALFAHRAVLFTGDRVPFSEVYEVYPAADPRVPTAGAPIGTVDENDPLRY